MKFLIWATLTVLFVFGVCFLPILMWVALVALVLLPAKYDPAIQLKESFDRTTKKD